MTEVYDLRNADDLGELEGQTGAPAPDERFHDHPSRDFLPVPVRMNDLKVAFDGDRRDAEDRRHQKAEQEEA